MYLVTWHHWCSSMEYVFEPLMGFVRLVDVIGRWRAASRVVTFYKYVSQGLPPLSSCSHTQCNLSPPPFTAFWFSVSLSHPLPSILLYLSAFLPASLPLRGRHTHMGVFAWISHFLFGVCIWSLVLVPSTHQTLVLLEIIEGDKKGGNTESKYTYMQYKGMMAKVERNGRYICVLGWTCEDRENLDWWHRRTENQGKLSKYWVVDYHDIRRNG